MLSFVPTTRRPLLLVVAGMVVIFGIVLLAPGQVPQRILAPELEGGTGWIGTDKPLQLKDLRGKIVVFDFWTLC